MTQWNFESPLSSDLKDREIAIQGSHLHGKRIALLITGSIAAYRMPDLVREFRREGADVVVFATRESLRYVTKESLEWTSLHPVIDAFTPEAEHLSDSAPFDAYLVAPATYSVINKVALGIADSVVTSTLASAIGKLEQHGTPILIAPAMHGSMHNSLLTKSLKTLDDLGILIIPPRQENGKNNLPSLERLVAETARSLTRSPLKDHPLLITGGPTPVPLDNIRRLTNKFTGSLAIHIAKEAWLRGARVHLILGAGSDNPPEYVDCHWIQTYNEYQETVNQILKHHSIQTAVFSAAVADYRPDTSFNGKIPSGQSPLTLNLVPTEKVIQTVRKQFPALYMVTFKYEENLTHDALMGIAQTRLDAGYNMVIANRGEELGPHGEHIAWIVLPGQPAISAIGKNHIAQALLDHLERHG